MSGLRALGTGLIAAVTFAIAVAEAGFSIELIGAIAVAAWWLVLLIVALGLSLARVGRGATGAAALLAGLAVLSGLSMGWASDPGLAFDELTRLVAYLGLFTLVVLVTPPTAAGIATWINGLTIGLSAVVAVALGSRLQEWLPGPREDLVELAPGVAGRLSFPVGYWNGLAALTALAALLLAWAGAGARGRLARAVATAWLPACGLAIYLTASRGGVAALVIGAAVLLIAAPNARRVSLGVSLGLGLIGALALSAIASGMPELVNTAGGGGGEEGRDLTLALLGATALVGLARYLLDPLVGDLILSRRALRLTTAAAVLAVLAAGVALDAPGRLSELSVVEEQEVLDVNTRNLGSSSGSGRVQFWEAGLDAFAQRPLAGIGAGGYGTWWNQNGSLSDSVESAHSVFIESLAELGIGGFLLLAGFFSVGLLAALRSRRSQPALAAALLAMLAAGISSAGIDWTWELPAVIGPVLIAVALATGPLRAQATAPADDRRSRPALRPALRATIVAVALAGIAVGSVEFLSQAKLSDSREAVADGRLGEAATDALEASVVQPWAAEPYTQLALVRELQGDLVAAEREIDEAIERADEDWGLWLVKSRLLLSSGDVDGARAALRRAIELNPRAPLFGPADLGA